MKNLDLTLQSGYPTLLVGGPGTGKTSFLEALAVMANRYFYQLIGAHLDPTDTGIPAVVDGKRTTLFPEWFDRMRMGGRKVADDQPGKTHPMGFLFIDELTSTPPDKMAGLLSLIREKRLHGRTLPHDTIVCSACNPPDQAVGGFPLDPPVINRFCVQEWHVDATELLDAMGGGEWPEPEFRKLPANWEVADLKRTMSMVSAFLRTRRDMVAPALKIENEAVSPFPSPRSWEGVARIQAAFESVKQAGWEDVVSGCVGVAAARVYVQWIRDINIPDAESLLIDPKLMPTGRDDQIYAALGSVIAAVAGDLKADRWLRAVALLGRCIEVGKIDVSFPAARSLAKMRPDSVRIAPTEFVAYGDALRKVAQA